MMSLNSNKIRLLKEETLLIYAFVVYFIGVIGLLAEGTQTIFTFLVPCNIIIAFILCFVYHKSWTLKFTISLIIIYILGFLLEWMGSYTGLIFGSYQYQGGLGVKVLGVPLVMGLNWALLVYSTTIISVRLSGNKFIIAVIGASLMLLYDLFLEPSAIKYQFWYWENEKIPLQNYMAWWVSGFVFIFYQSTTIKGKQKNLVAEGIFWLQLAFFATLLIFNNLIR